MRTSETIGKVSEALAKAQGEMRNVGFDAVNPHFRNRYATLAAIVEMARSHLAKHDICLCQATEREESQQGPLMRVICRLAHKSGEWIEGAITVRPSKDDPQQVGSALTYARRYLVASMLNLASDEDDDGNAASVQGKPVKSPETARPATQKEKKPSGPRKAKPDASLSEAIANLKKIAHANGVKPGEGLKLVSVFLGREVLDLESLTLDEIAFCTQELQNADNQ